MALRIGTNIASLNAQRNLAISTKSLEKVNAQLASGKRINRSSDDAAGMTVASNLQADIKSLIVAKRNALDAVSMVQTAEGGLVETGNMLSRLRELSVQAASDTVGVSERGFLNKEFFALKGEIDRIAISTEFNGTRLLVGKTEIPEELSAGSNPSPLEIQVSGNYFESIDGDHQSNPVDLIRIDFKQINSMTYGEDSLDLGKGVEGTNILTKEEAQISINQLDSAIEKINNDRSTLGAYQNRFFSTINNLAIQIENYTESRSRVIDTDFAEATAKLTSAQILQQAGISVLANVNTQPKVALALLK